MVAIYDGMSSPKSYTNICEAVFAALDLLQTARHFELRSVSQTILVVNRYDDAPTGAHIGEHGALSKRGPIGIHTSVAAQTDIFERAIKFCINAMGYMPCRQGTVWDVVKRLAAVCALGIPLGSYDGCSAFRRLPEREFIAAMQRYLESERPMTFDKVLVQLIAA